jgi:hypothetical protein
MPTSQPNTGHAQYCLRTFRVLRVEEEGCDVWSGAEVSTVRFTELFPAPRVERVCPGHLVAVATGPTGNGLSWGGGTTPLVDGLRQGAAGLTMQDRVTTGRNYES